MNRSLDDLEDTQEIDIESYQQDVNYEDDNCERSNYEGSKYISDRIILLLFFTLKLILKVMLFPFLVLLFIIDKFLGIFSRVISIGLIIAFCLSVIMLIYKYYYINELEINDFINKIISSFMVLAIAIIILVIRPLIHVTFAKIKGFIFGEKSVNT